MAQVGAKLTRLGDINPRVGRQNDVGLITGYERQNPKTKSK
jgi:hypothetical protein